MKRSQVYFTDMRIGANDSLPKKLNRLINAAGIDSIDFKKKFVAIKVHFGEPGNLAYLRPNYARVIVDKVRELGGIPFLTDANTLYVGRRKHALEHMEAAYENGFSPFSTGCHIIIADGLKGTDEALVDIDGKYVKQAKIGRAVMDADIVISLSHFKGHEAAGFGGAIKNIGMGCGSRAGKMEMHSSGKPFINASKCVKCRMCVSSCAHDAISLTDESALINDEKCVGCGRCIGRCLHDAIRPRWDEANEVLGCKMAEYTLAVLQGRPHFHISLAIDISPLCDCCGFNDVPIAPDIGMFASFDPVALDMACVDAANSATAHSPMHSGDLFKAHHPDSDWKACLAHSEAIGLGTRDYELINISTKR